MRREISADQEIREGRGRRKLGFLQLCHLLALWRENGHWPPDGLDSVDQFTKDETLASAGAPAKQDHTITRLKKLLQRLALFFIELGIRRRRRRNERVTCPQSLANGRHDCPLAVEHFRQRDLVLIGFRPYISAPTGDVFQFVNPNVCTSHSLQRCLPELVFADDRMAVEQVLFRPGYGFLHSFAGSLGRPRAGSIYQASQVFPLTVGHLFLPKPSQFGPT